MVTSDVTALGIVKDGRFRPHNPQALAMSLSRFPCEATVEATFTQQRAARSQRQNRFYWGVLVHELSEHTGFTPDEMHEWLKLRFIPKKLAVCNGNGEVIDERVVGGSTRKMTTTQFEDYMETIRRWAAEELGVFIPDPDADATTASANANGHGWGI